MCVLKMWQSHSLLLNDVRFCKTLVLHRGGGSTLQAFLRTRLEKRIGTSTMFKLVYTWACDISFWKKRARTAIKLQSIWVYYIRVGFNCLRAQSQTPIIDASAVNDWSLYGKVTSVQLNLWYIYFWLYKKGEKQDICSHACHDMSELGRPGPWHKWCDIVAAPNSKREWWEWKTTD
jgi:hypothetical protein